MGSTFDTGRADLSGVSQLARGELAPGTVIADQFRVESMLGQGGMGQIYRATDLELNRIVAVKRISPALLNDSSAFAAIAQARFRGEAFLPAQISDDNVITVLGFKEALGEQFLILEFIPDAKTLKDVIEQHREARTWMPKETLTSYLRQATSGLAAIHKHNDGVFHRDIKPQNLVVFSAATGAQRLKIIDFGVAHVPGADLTLTGMSIGTPSYLPPEFFLVEDGTPVTLDCRADLFGLGVSFYLAATLSRPWGGITDIRTAAVAYQQREAAPVSAYREDFSPGLEAILMKLLAKDRTRRYQSAQEVLNDLNQLENVPAYAPPEPVVIVEGSQLERLQVADSDMGDFGEVDLGNFGAVSGLDSMFVLTDLGGDEPEPSLSGEAAAFAEAVNAPPAQSGWGGLKKRDRVLLGVAVLVALVLVGQLGVEVVTSSSEERKLNVSGLVTLPEKKPEPVSGRDILRDANQARKKTLVSLGETARVKKIAEETQVRLRKQRAGSSPEPKTGSSPEPAPEVSPKPSALAKAKARPKRSGETARAKPAAKDATEVGESAEVKREKILPEHFQRWNEKSRATSSEARGALGVLPGDLIEVTLDVVLTSTSPQTPVTALALTTSMRGKVRVPGGSLFLGKPRFHITDSRAGHVTVNFETLVLPDGREFKVSAVAVRQNGAAGIAGRVKKTGSRGKATTADAVTDVAGALLPGGIAGALGDRLVRDQRAANRDLRESQEVLTVPRGTRFQIRILKGV